VLKEIAHFLRKAPEVMRLQRQYDRAGFVDALNARVDAQGYAEVRRELVGDLSGRVLEVGCGPGTMFEYYGDGVELDAIEPEPDFLELALAKAGRGQVALADARPRGARSGCRRARSDRRARG
jgi:SAM-dependent methyltransferase